MYRAPSAATCSDSDWWSHISCIGMCLHILYISLLQCGWIIMLLLLLLLFTIVVWLTSFFGTYETVLYLMVLMPFCLPSSLELGIILLVFVLAVTCSACIRLLSTTSVLLVGSFWGFTFLSTEGFSTDADGSKTLRVSDL